MSWYVSCGRRDVSARRLSFSMDWQVLVRNSGSRKTTKPDSAPTIEAQRVARLDALRTFTLEAIEYCGAGMACWVRDIWICKIGRQID